MELVSQILLILGAIALLTSSIGVLRFDNIFTRLHPAGITESLGLPLIILGLMLKTGWTLVTLKLGILMFLLWFTCATACHALAQAAYQAKRPTPENQPPENTPNTTKTKRKPA